MQSHEALLRHIEKRSKALRPVLMHPQKGWIREMRQALGITLAKLGDLCGLATPTIAQAERRELEGKLSLETLRKTAEAMNCELTYSFIPKSDMTEFIEKKAYEKAKRILNVADTHMSLENQKVTSDIEMRILRLQKKLIAEGKVW